MKLPLTVALDEDENNSAKVFNDPPSILRDDKTGELFIIELQGKLEVEQDGDDELEEHAHAGQKVGKLDMSMPTRPTLLIGHHRLIGQIVKLNTPLAILRHTLPPKLPTPSSSIPRPPPTSSPLQPRIQSASATAMLDGDIPSSSPLKKRDRSSSPAEGDDVADEESNPAKRLQTGDGPSTTTNGDNLATPLPTRLAPTQTRNYDVPNSSPFLAPPLSSALTNRTSNSILAPSTPLNVSELKAGKHEILGILKSKIIFSKRPEPVVKLDEESEEEA
ncbi:hypothetical protein P389DRAFT_96588 [Cystobasidium minutum MCA 4210]|uniref:uncharacterized protein n=1 Tax=Cystobasidium minutum MCA 4210 TaxID=1397322 RepID=UPI0034CFDA84|eukprot:jgi/Rhomi1/96588/CE96587_88